jgi:hypothetical protein
MTAAVEAIRHLTSAFDRRPFGDSAQDGLNPTTGNRG